MMDKIEAITTERGKNYGAPIDHFQTTCHLFQEWDARFTHANQKRNGCYPPEPDQARVDAATRHGVYMILDKLVRMAENPNHMDNIDDIQGYARCLATFLAPTPEEDQAAVNAAIAKRDNTFRELPGPE